MIGKGAAKDCAGRVGFGGQNGFGKSALMGS